jgi:hypothetical protein
VIKMENKDILETLAGIASDLDNQNMTKEADVVTDVMKRVAQFSPMPFTQQMPQQNSYNPLAPVDLRSVNIPQTPALASPVYTLPANVQAPQSLQNFMQNPNAQQPAQATTPENELIKRYLGWAFDAITRKGKNVSETRAALEQHLKSSKQSLEFGIKTLSAFDAQIASQKALQNRQ